MLVLHDCNLAQVEVQSTLNTDVWGMRSASVYLQGFKQEFTKGSVSSHKFKLFNKVQQIWSTGWNAELQRNRTVSENVTFVTLNVSCAADQTLSCWGQRCSCVYPQNDFFWFLRTFDFKSVMFIWQHWFKEDQLKINKLSQWSVISFQPNLNLHHFIL